MSSFLQLIKKIFKIYILSWKCVMNYQQHATQPGLHKGFYQQYATQPGFP